LEFLILFGIGVRVAGPDGWLDRPSLGELSCCEPLLGVQSDWCCAAAFEQLVLLFGWLN